jgi:hypothetical protein
MDPGTGSAKAELSTLPESGTFYFALTAIAARIPKVWIDQKALRSNGLQVIVSPHPQTGG